MSEDEPERHDPSPWTNDELRLLHDMVRDYDHSLWLRGQLWWWGRWVLGVPFAIVSAWQAVDWVLHKVGLR